MTSRRGRTGEAGPAPNDKLKLRKLLVAAAAFHLVLTLSLFFIGRAAIIPNDVNPNGIGVSFAADCKLYLKETASMAAALRELRFKDWLNQSSQLLGNPLPLKFYSLSFLFLGPTIGYNIISAEPLNMLYYLLILSFVFLIGREVFNERAGLIAAGIVALWPSFLLHTTQLLRDPLFIAMLLAVVFVCVTWLTRVQRTSRGLILGALGGLAAIILWLIRADMWEVVLGIITLGFLFLIVRQIRERRLLWGNLLSALLLLAVAFGASKFIGAYRQSNTALLGSSAEAALADTTSQVSGSDEPGTISNRALATSFWSRIPLRIRLLRDKFVRSYPGAGSNVDTEVEFDNLWSVVRYLPRAALIGFGAPFPDMWFTSGAEVGLKGRLLSGLETFGMYLIEALALLTIWRERRLEVWLLLLVSAIGSIALGLVVLNLGALYRMRYVFWMLLIILGAPSVSRLFFKSLPIDDSLLSESPPASPQTSNA